MAISLAQAAEATGRNRSTILRSIKRGMLSATRDQRTQAWVVEPVELFRVFPPVPASGNAQRAQGDAQAHNGGGIAKSGVLIARLEAAEARIADKDTTISEQRVALDDLRQRLNRAEEERAKAQAQLAAVLTDQRGNGAAHPAAPASPWRRFLAWRRA